MCEVLAKLGIKDERIFEALIDVFEHAEPVGASMFANYGDPRALPLVEDAIVNFEPDFTRLWGRADLVDLLDAHEELGGALAPALRERIDGWLAEWDAARTRTNVAGASVKQRKVGRNEPCPCGSGKKYKKCCLDSDEAARPRVVEAETTALDHRHPRRTS